VSGVLDTAGAGPRGRCRERFRLDHRGIAAPEPGATRARSSILPRSRPARWRGLPGKGSRRVTAWWRATFSRQCPNANMQIRKYAIHKFTIETGDTYPRQLRPWLAPCSPGESVPPESMARCLKPADSAYRIIEIASPVPTIEASLRQSPARRLSPKGRTSGMRYLRRLAPASHSEIARSRDFTDWSERQAPAS
jgi:hypothetical protein